MSNKIKVLLGICLTLVLCFALNLNIKNEKTAEAAEIVPAEWILAKNPSKLSVADSSEGGVATVSYTSLSSDSAENMVTLKITNYDVNDNRLSIKYDADFTVTGQNITIEISYSSGSDENTGEDYDGGKVLCGWFENWNVENGKTRDGYDLITLDFSSYVGGKTINGIVFTFNYAGDSSTTKTINFLGVDLHPDSVTPQFVTDGPIAEGSIYIGQWVPDDEIGNMQYSTTETGETTIHYDKAPTGKSRIVAPLYGHDLTLLPTLKVKYSSDKNFNLAIYINGTSTSLMSYTNITNKNGELSFDLSTTMEKICILVDRKDYYDSSTYTTDSPTKDVYLEFYFVDQEGKEIKVHSVANNSGSGSSSGGGNESGSGSGSTTPSTPTTPTGPVSIGEFTDKKMEAGNLQTSYVDGTHVFSYTSAPTGKSRVYATVSGHTVSAYPTLEITYSCDKAFALAVYINGTSNSLLYHVTYSGNGVITLDLSSKGDVKELVIMVDRSGFEPAGSYDDGLGKTVYLKFDFLDASGNVAGSGSDNQGGDNSGSGTGSTTPPASGDVVFGSWQNESAGNMQYSVNEAGQTVIYFASTPTGKSRIYATVSGHSASSYQTLQIKYSSTKEFNFAVYINGTSTSILSYEDITDNEGVLLLEVSQDVTEIYIMVDRSGRENASTYTDGLGKTVYLEFEFLSSNGN